MKIASREANKLEAKSATRHVVSARDFSAAFTASASTS